MSKKTIKFGLHYPGKPIRSYGEDCEFDEILPDDWDEMSPEEKSKYAQEAFFENVEWSWWVDDEE